MIASSTTIANKKTNDMSTKTAMIRPPPPSGPPPPRSTQMRRPVNRPPPPKRPKTSSSPLKNKPAPPPLRSNISPLPPKTRITSHFCLKKRPISIKKPVVLRDVTVFERRQQVGQGTYGSVFMGAYKDTGEVVALKRINTEQEENGFPITAIREVKILTALNHPNIVKLKEIVTSKGASTVTGTNILDSACVFRRPNGHLLLPRISACIVSYEKLDSFCRVLQKNEIPKNVFMVFEYLEYDLTGILETPEIRFGQDHIKSWANQLLKGAHYMHVNKIVHRDLKSSNLLINRAGELKIADWGLARSWNPEMERLTNRVITLWYRPPELLLGCNKYSTKIDMWSIGCIISEMFRRSGFLTGSNEATQLELIFKTCGHPCQKEWPNINTMCPLWKNFQPGPMETPLPSRIRESLKEKLTNPRWMTENALQLLEKLFAHNPDSRWSASDALTAEYFFESPLTKKASELSMKLGVDSVHEWEARKKSEQRRSQVKRKNANGLVSKDNRSG